MRDLLLIVLLGGGSLYALYRPWVGAMLWTRISLMSPHVSFGYATAGYPFGLLTALTTLLGLIDFGGFNANLLVEQTVKLRSEQPNLQLTVLEAESTPVGAKLLLQPGEQPGQWLLTVTLPPKTVGREMSNQNAVILQTNDSPPRRLRVPVIGKPY